MHISVAGSSHSGDLSLVANGLLCHPTRRPKKAEGGLYWSPTPQKVKLCLYWNGVWTHGLTPHRTWLPQASKHQFFPGCSFCSMPRESSYEGLSPSCQVGSPGRRRGRPGGWHRVGRQLRVRLGQGRSRGSGAGFPRLCLSNPVSIFISSFLG